MGAVKFCKVPKHREQEIFDREKVIRIQGMYLGESGTIYFVEDSLANSFENDINICYNNNIKKKVSFIEPISKIEEENPFINLDIELEL